MRLPLVVIVARVRAVDLPVDLELIIVDDYSTDGTRLVLDNLSSNTSLTGGAGTTTNNAPTGSPYVVATTGNIAPGASIRPCRTNGVSRRGIFLPRRRESRKRADLTAAEDAVGRRVGG